MRSSDGTCHLGVRKSYWILCIIKLILGLDGDRVTRRSFYFFSIAPNFVSCPPYTYSTCSILRIRRTDQFMNCMTRHLFKFFSSSTSNAPSLPPCTVRTIRTNRTSKEEEGAIEDK